MEERRPQDGDWVRLTPDAAEALRRVGFPTPNRPGRWLSYQTACPHLTEIPLVGKGFVVFREEEEVRRWVASCPTGVDFRKTLRQLAEKDLAAGVRECDVVVEDRPANTRRGRKHKMRMPALPLEVVG